MRAFAWIAVGTVVRGRRRPGKAAILSGLPGGDHGLSAKAAAESSCAARQGALARGTLRPFFIANLSTGEFPMRVFLRLLVLCLPFWAPPLWAASPEALYQVRESLAGQSPEQRSEALQRALDTLVLRLTGDPQALLNPQVQALRADPQQLARQFGYADDHVLVEFDPLTSESRLREAGLALWGVSRPALLVWWLNQGVDGSQLVGDAQDGASLLQQAAQHRGLPIRLPLADLSEQLLISDELLQGDAEAVLQEPAVRYEADMQLLVLARQHGSAWQADWLLLLGDGEERGQLEASDQASLADALLLTLSQRLAPRFVVRPEAASQLVLEVQGADLARFAQLERVLEPFAARLLRVEGDRLRYRLQASAQQLHAQLSLLQLQVVPAEVPAIQPVTAEQSGEAPLAAAAQVPAASVALLQYRWP